MRNGALALLLTALVVPATGCATKEYVRQVVGQSQAKLDAQLREQGQLLGAQVSRLDAATARLDAQGKQVDELGGRFTKLETSVDEFGTIVRSASTKADEAATRAEEINTRVSRLLADRGKRRLVETNQVHFALNRAELTDATQTALAALIRELAENPALTVDPQGYADSTGPVDYNLELSERRVSAVRRFLVTHGVDLPRISWIGLGMLADRGSPGERAQNRRVTVRLMVPEDELGPQRSRSSAGPGGEKAREPESSKAPEEPKAPQPEAAAAKPAPEASPAPAAEAPKEPETPTVAPTSAEEGGKPTDQKQ